METSVRRHCHVRPSLPTDTPETDSWDPRPREGRTPTHGLVGPWSGRTSGSSAEVPSPHTLILIF